MTGVLTSLAVSAAIETGTPVKPENFDRSPISEHVQQLTSDELKNITPISFNGEYTIESPKVKKISGETSVSVSDLTSNVNSEEIPDYEGLHDSDIGIVESPNEIYSSNNEMNLQIEKLKAQLGGKTQQDLNVEIAEGLAEQDLEDPELGNKNTMDDEDDDDLFAELEELDNEGKELDNEGKELDNEGKELDKKILAGRREILALKEEGKELDKKILAGKKEILAGKEEGKELDKKISDLKEFIKKGHAVIAGM